MLLDDFDAWYKHNRYESVQKQGYGSAKMPWALAGDEEFFPDDLNYSDEYTKKWKGWYDDWKPMVENPVNAESYFRQNDKQTRVWNPDPDIVDAGWEETDPGDWGKAYGDGETTGWGTAGDMAGEVYTEVNDPGYGGWGQQQGDPDYKIDKTDPNWKYNWAESQGDAPGEDGTPGPTSQEDTSGTDPGYTDFFKESGGNSGWTVNWGTGSSGPPQEGMIWSSQAGRWIFPPDPTPPEPEPTPQEPDTSGWEVDQTDPMWGSGHKKTPHLTQLGDYLLHEHLGQLQNLVGGTDITNLLSQLPVSASGELAIGGDDQLEASLNLPDDVRAVQVGGEVQMRADPYQADDIAEQVAYHSSSHTAL